MNYFSRFAHRRRGQSLIEILVALFIGMLLFVAAAAILTPALKTNKDAEKIQVGGSLARQLLDNAAVFAESNWHNIDTLVPSAHYHLSTSSLPFGHRDGDESIMVGTSTYTRFFFVENVNRDSNGNIALAGGQNDPSTKKITAGYSWVGGGVKTMSRYVTRSRNEAFLQSDWSGGADSALPPQIRVPNKFSSALNIDFTSTTGSIHIPSLNWAPPPIPPPPPTPPPGRTPQPPPPPPPPPEPL